MVEYVRPNGRNPFREWFDGLDPHARIKITAAIERLRQGNASRLKWLGGIGELVINWGPGYRVYVAAEGHSVILLLGGGTKPRQQADIDRARCLRDEYVRAKRED